MVFAIAAFACAVLIPELRLLGLIGFPVFFLAISILGKTGQDARSLQLLVEKSVWVEVWGLPLPASEGVIFQIDSISSLGPGLWVHMHSVSGGPKIKLKIAQPTSIEFIGSQIAITFAGYVQWDSQKFKSPTGQRAPGTVVLSMA
jgi:hypothetical protein